MLSFSCEMSLGENESRQNIMEVFGGVAHLDI